MVCCQALILKVSSLTCADCDFVVFENPIATGTMTTAPSAVTAPPR